MIKGQTLADFIVKFTNSNTTKVAGTTNNVEAVKRVEMGKGTTSVARQEDANPWIFYTDNHLMRMGQEQS